MAMNHANCEFSLFATSARPLAAPLRAVAIRGDQAPRLFCMIRALEDGRRSTSGQID
jgi:hypothetical protein